MFPVSFGYPFLTADRQKSEQLAKLLANYANEPIRGIDPTRYAPPTVSDDATEEELAEAEKRGRISEGHMELR